LLIHLRRVKYETMRSLLDVVGRLSPSPAGTRPRHFSLIDLGSDTVKAVVVRREKTGARVLGFGFAPTEGRGLGGGRANVAALASITDGALVAAEDRTNVADRGKVVPDEALFCIPARFIRGECFAVRQTRADPTNPIATRELKSVWERVERLARERLPSLGEDDVTWKPLAITPGAITVDGLQVTDPVALKGRELSLSAFGVAVWPQALQTIETVAERLELALITVVAAPQSLASIVPQREAILVEIGAQGTSVHLVQHDALVSTAWWPQGGEFFTRSLSQAFRCVSEEAEALKRAYADQALSARDEDLVAQALVNPTNAWLETLVAWLFHTVKSESTCRPVNAPLDSSRANLLPGRIYLTGGGSLLPDLATALRSLEAVPSLSFRRSLEFQPLGLSLGARTPGRLPLLDVPPHPVSDLLTPAMSLATCLE
jgi:cell division ATPase FtsA